jgi:hypothetical protein
MIRALIAIVVMALAAGGLAPRAAAGEADVVGVEAKPESGGKWRFHVTLRHADEGWDHYADKWDVVAPDGTLLGTRVLLHPHETEQPFTRSLGGVALPEGVGEVTLRGHDSVHDYGGAEMTISVAR